MQANNGSGRETYAIQFCERFLGGTPETRYVFGTNDFAESIANSIEIAGFINDVSPDTSYLGKPVLRIENVPGNALVVSAVALARPLTAEKKLSAAAVRHLDYFSFYDYSGLSIKSPFFWDTFRKEYQANKEKFDRIEGLLSDQESRRTFNNLVDFRLSGDLSYMEGYTDRQQEQYWEDFLELREHNEVFVDAGGFDGLTSEEFVKRCPHYRSIYFFEPDAKNMNLAKERLGACKSIKYMLQGLSDKERVVRFSTEGTSSAISEDGEVEVLVNALDECVDDAVSFLKMDIEGAEAQAIAGARETISKHHPRLAICVYHKADCLWKIPEAVFSVRTDYDIYLRHYTEGITETVMFFIPRRYRN